MRFCKGQLTVAHVMALPDHLNDSETSCCLGLRLPILNVLVIQDVACSHMLPTLTLDRKPAIS